MRKPNLSGQKRLHGMVSFTIHVSRPELLVSWFPELNFAVTCCSRAAEGT